MFWQSIEHRKMSILCQKWIITKMRLPVLKKSQKFFKINKITNKNKNKNTLRDYANIPRIIESVILTPRKKLYKSLSVPTIMEMNRFEWLFISLKTDSWRSDLVWILPSDAPPLSATFCRKIWSYIIAFDGVETSSAVKKKKTLLSNI